MPVPNTGINRKSVVTEVVEILGDRWTFLILGEAFFGVRSFDQFLAHLGIATNILSNRLKMLVEHEIMAREKDPGDARRFTYQLTEKGRDIYAIPLAMMQWGNKWLAGEEGPPLILHHKSCGNVLEPVMCCAHCKEIINARDVTYQQIRSNEGE